jgi:hypothetical protein
MQQHFCGSCRYVGSWLSSPMYMDPKLRRTSRVMDRLCFYLAPTEIEALLAGNTNVLPMCCLDHGRSHAGGFLKAWCRLRVSPLTTSSRNDEEARTTLRTTFSCLLMSQLLWQQLDGSEGGLH